MVALTDPHDRTRMAGVLALVLLACGLSLAIGFVFLQLSFNHRPPGGNAGLQIDAPAALVQSPPARFLNEARR